VPLAPKTFDLLVLLVCSDSRALSKKDLMSALWPETFVEEASLSFQVATLRKVLGEEGIDWIETIPKHGYRFAVPVSRPAEAREPRPGEASQVPAIRSVRIWAVSAMLATFTAGFLALLHFREGPARQPLVRFSIPPPDGKTSPLNMISPDGRYIVSVIVDLPEKKTAALGLRALDSDSWRMLPGTEGATNPFWSPDSQFVGFFTGDSLMKISVFGGPPQSIVHVRGLGGAWSRDGTILFSMSPETAEGGNQCLYRVPAIGGVPVRVTTVDTGRGDRFHARQYFLPDGRHYIYLAGNQVRQKAGIFLSSIDAPDSSRQLLRDVAAAVYASPGYMLFVRGQKLMAQRFDLQRLELESTPITLAECAGDIKFSVSADGVLVYRGLVPERTLSQLAWYDREGKRLDTIETPGYYRQIALSPDCKHVAVERFEGFAETPDLWLLDLSRRIFSRLTFEPAIWEGYPVWSPDSRRLVFTADPPDAFRQLREITVASGANTLLYRDAMVHKFPDDWSRDGRFIIYRGDDRFVTLLSLEGERTAKRILDFSSAEQFHFSPDGGWVAYQSDESGRTEVYVASLPGFVQKTQLSDGGGGHPLWRRDGKELFYLTRDGAIMSLPIQTGSSVNAGRPKLLFRIGRNLNLRLDQYGVAADGQRFLINTPIGAPTTAPLNVVTPWTALLDPHSGGVSR
jgi:DNA-binding winged helix-turn-helix (wHTH) protein